ncbi:hypothetical protein PI125_g26122, partial [Phytophthora idaei]
MARKVWFQLVDAATRGAYAVTQTASVSSDRVSDIEDLREAIREKYRHEKPDILEGIVADQLRVYANRAAYDVKENTLEEDSSIGTLGGSKKNALIVEVPTQYLVPRTVATVAELIAIPSTTVLNEPDKYAEECISLTEWGVDAVHEIPLIW